MKRSAHFSAARLAVAGYASIALLAWIGFMPGSLPVLWLRQESLAASAVTAAISLFVMVILAPVLWHGPRGNRWLAAMIAVFPLLAFGLTGAWLVARIGR